MERVNINDKKDFVKLTINMFKQYGEQNEFLKEFKMNHRDHTYTFNFNKFGDNKQYALQRDGETFAKVVDMKSNLMLTVIDELAMKEFKGVLFEKTISPTLRKKPTPSPFYIPSRPKLR
jgi:ATP:corrinoid adenosyltransferase